MNSPDTPPSSQDLTESSSPSVLKQFDPVSHSIIPSALPQVELKRDPQHQAEVDFQQISRTMGFFGAMLLPILIATAWSFHGQDTRMLPDILASMILYSVIAGYGWVWRADWIHLLRPPAKITTPLVIMVVLIPVLSVAIAVGMTFAANALSLDIMEITPALLDAEWSIPMCFVWIAVLPPVMEEIAFRGIMLSRLQSVMSPRNVVWLTSILFGLLHFDILAMAFLLVPLAVAAAYLTRLSGSLYPAILVHAAHNTAIVALELGMRY